MPNYKSKSKVASKQMGKNKPFSTCSRCPTPSSCKRAGKCLAKAMS